MGGVQPTFSSLMAEQSLGFRVWGLGFGVWGLGLIGFVGFVGDVGDRIRGTLGDIDPLNQVPV